MKRYIPILFLFLASSIMLISCEDLLNQGSKSDYEYVSYGTSFGECLGYCIKQIEVSGNEIDFEKRGWEIEGSLPDVTEKVALDSVAWLALLEKIDIGEFFSLDSIIGCPDCADGGAEWIEIKKDDVVRKVTFEYWNEPDEVKDYISILRGYLESFE